MKAILGVVMLAGALLTAVVLGAPHTASDAGQQATAPVAPAPPAAVVPDVAVTVPADQAATPVPMVELTFADGKTVTGRLLKEDDQTVYVTALGGGTIGYQHSLIKSTRRFTMSAAEYGEKAADLLADQLWKVQDAPGTFVKARQQYLAAIALAPAPEDRDRMQAKLTSLERERDAWQAESLRRSDLQKSKDEADLVRLQKDLAQQQLAALQTLDSRLRQVEQGVRQTQLSILELQDYANRVGQNLNDLNNLQRNNPIFVPYPVYVDVKKPHDDQRPDDQKHDDDHQDQQNPNVPKP